MLFHACHAAYSGEQKVITRSHDADLAVVRVQVAVVQFFQDVNLLLLTAIEKTVSVRFDLADILEKLSWEQVMLFQATMHLLDLTALVSSVEIESVSSAATPK